MGTRNLTIVVLNNFYKVAQYCQWDGYVTGQGATVLKFLESLNGNFHNFTNKVSQTSFVREDHIAKLWELAGAKDGMATMDVSDKMKKQFPQFQRDMGANVLEAILNGSVTELQNEINFAGDSLFCEWAYVIDLDKNQLEVYRGFNKEPLLKNDRFKFLEDKKKEYYPIKLAAIFPFDQLPSVKEMDLACRNAEEIAELEESDE